MIPNICHFIFGLKKQTDEFLFCYFISVYSCYIINKPDIIYFYYHYTPFGKWWNQLKNIPNIKLEKVKIPTHFGKKEIIKTAHKADKIRMCVLYKKGGIYLDIDTICIKPWKELLHNDVVLGKEGNYGICNAIMFSKPKSNFFKIWLKYYEYYFKTDGWNKASIMLPKKIANKYPHLLVLKDEDTFFLPSYRETNKIFEIENKIPKNLISLHLWETFSLPYLKNIKDWNWVIENNYTMYGKILLKLIIKINYLSTK